MRAASAAFEPLTIETRPSDEASAGQKYDGSRTSEPIAKRICSVPGRDRVDVELVAGGILHEHELDVVSADASRARRGRRPAGISLSARDAVADEKRSPSTARAVEYAAAASTA